jgi:hypothetical protein
MKQGRNAIHHSRKKRLTTQPHCSIRHTDLPQLQQEIQYSNKVDLDIDLHFLGAVATVVACLLQWLLSVKGATAAVAAAALRLALSVIVHVYMMICMIHIYNHNA